MAKRAGKRVSIKRAYDRPDAADGERVLVDRLWPRGVKKESAEIDRWLKDVAPSPELRKWWQHDPQRMDEFAARYRAELAENPAVDELREMLERTRPVTLVYGAKDERVNHARILAEYLEE